MTRKSLALAMADPVRHAVSAQIPEGRTGYRRGQRSVGLPRNREVEARILGRIWTIRQAAPVDSTRACSIAAQLSTRGFLSIKPRFRGTGSPRSRWRKSWHRFITAPVPIGACIGIRESESASAADCAWG